MSIRAQFGVNSSSIRDQFGVNSGAIRDQFGVDPNDRPTAINVPMAVGGRPPFHFFPVGVSGGDGGEAPPGKKRPVTCVDKERFLPTNYRTFFGGGGQQNLN